MHLPDKLQEKYRELKPEIQQRLFEFSQVQESDYFYELCFCICTPQSKAKNAYQVQKLLMEKNFLENDFDPTSLLREPSRYIRFHNQKAKRLLYAKEFFSNIKSILDTEITASDKRIWLADNFNGFGMKESAHFLRNIGYRGLAILDRHILKHLVYCGVYNETPAINNKKKYLAVEERFNIFADYIQIPIDELDLLFWSYETGEIFK
jgi:N-glycosylase/DNA lyase